MILEIKIKHIRQTNVYELSSINEININQKLIRGRYFCVGLNRFEYAIYKYLIDTNVFDFNFDRPIGDSVKNDILTYIRRKKINKLKWIKN